MNQDALVAYIESKEAGKRSISRLSSRQGAEAARNSYHQQHTSLHSEHSGKCSHCGTIGHGDGSNKRTRREKCPAYGQKCTTCTRKHHFFLSLQVKAQTSAPASSIH